MTDEELILAYREGCGPGRNDALDELFRRHQARVERWCGRFTRDRESTMDLVQEVFLRVYRNLDGYRGDSRFSTWLYVITRNQCISAIQRRVAEPVCAAAAITADVPDINAKDIHDTVETEQSRRKNWRFILDSLDQTEAKVMMLHYGQELSLNAVNRLLGLTNKSGAKAYIVSARRKLNAIQATRKTAVVNTGAAVGGREAAGPTR
jgi:RNA polymerase sigma-70 factor (ECF subfamily)